MSRSNPLRSGCNGRQFPHARAYLSDRLRRRAAALMGAANMQQLRCTLVFACLQGCAYAYKEIGDWLNVNKMMINNKNNIYCCA